MARQFLHFEPYVHLVELTATTALISWGGFYFYRSFFGCSWKLAHDHQLQLLGLDRKQTIGASAESYGNAHVTVFDTDNKAVAGAETRDRNHLLIEGLQPDTEYTYKIRVDGRDFTAGILYDCAFDASGRHLGLQPGGGHYDLSFRTFPSEHVDAHLDFAVLGDYGVGIHKFLGGYRQRTIARALELAVDVHAIRLVLTTGDNIYKDFFRRYGTGSEDDDWFFAFYQPYRYILSRVPFYPSVGNHDTNDTEKSDDRLQLLDNFYIEHRFQNGGVAPLDPGLVYRFPFGKTAEFLCLDSSYHEESGCRFWELPEYQAFIKRSLAAGNNDSGEPHWRIVFAHHPPYCAGPRYGNDEAMLRSLVPLLEQVGLGQASGCIMFSGHEHNFQYAHHKGVDYFISGAGGKLRREPPALFGSAHTRAWAAAPHFLLMSLAPRHVAATPLGLASGDRLLPVHLRGPKGETLRAPILLSRVQAHGKPA